MQKLVIRGFALDDVGGLHRLSSGHGWAHTEADWRTILACGAVIGHCAGSGDIVSSAALFGYGRRLAALGMLVVRDDWRRRGLGGDLLDACLERARQNGDDGGRPVMLVATRDGFPLYLKRGFQTVDDLHRFVAPEGVRFEGLADPFAGDRRVSIQGPVPHSVMDLDRTANGCHRGTFLSSRIAQAERAIIVSDGGTPVGYGLLTRQNGLGVIGPVVAASPGAALAVIRGLTEMADGPFRIDVPGRQQGFFAPLHDLGFVDEEVVPIMLRGAKTPPGQRDLVYAIAGQAFC